MRLSGFQLPVEHFSATSLGRAVACPEAWRRRYILHEKEAFGVERFIGSVDHRTIELCLAERMQGIEWDDKELDAVYDYVWAQQLEREEEPTFGLEDPIALIERGKKMVALYHEKVIPTLAPLTIEKRFEQVIPSVPVPVIGYLDIETSSTVIERKTAANRVSKPKPTWRLQGALYGLVTEKPIVYHVVTKQATPQLALGGPAYPNLVLARQNPDATVQLVQQVSYQLNDYYQRYGPDRPWPMTGVLHEWHCDYCSYKTRGCAAWSHLDQAAA